MRINSISNTQTQNRQSFGATPIGGVIARWDAAVQILNDPKATAKERQLVQKHLGAIKGVMPNKFFSIDGSSVFLHDTVNSGGTWIGFINHRLKGAKVISDIRKVLKTYARGHKS